MRFDANFSRRIRPDDAETSKHIFYFELPSKFRPKIMGVPMGSVCLLMGVPMGSVATLMGVPMGRGPGARAQAPKSAR